MPRPIFEIDELLRLVVDDLVETSPRAAVSFALTCRSHEEPTLSSLWGKQVSLTVLVMVSPSCTWVKDEDGIEAIAIERDPPALEWARLRRYASWMRGLDLGLGGNPTGGTISRLSCNSPEVLFPKLEWLRWYMWEASAALAFFRLCLSPHLKRVAFYNHEVPDQLEALIQIISFLPTSLQDLAIHCDQRKAKVLQDAISSFVCRCGPPLRSFNTGVPISAAAIHYLMQLPNLSNWRIVQGPPRATPTSIFPSLGEFRLEESEPLPWLHLLTSHANVRERLKSLDFPSTVIDSTLLSCVTKFQNLVTLHMRTYNRSCGERCIFRLTDDGVGDLVATLPRLKSLRLGLPCRRNSCKNTVASLMSISIHCPDLTALETHFNTKTIVGDMKRLLDGGVGRDEAKCKLESLWVFIMPLMIREEDIETVATGFKVIFPRLKSFTGYNVGRWEQLESRLED